MSSSSKGPLAKPQLSLRILRATLLQNEVGTKHFFDLQIYYEKCFDGLPKCLGLIFVCPKENPLNSRQISRKIALQQI